MRACLEFNTHEWKTMLKFPNKGQDHLHPWQTTKGNKILSLYTHFCDPAAVWKFVARKFIRMLRTCRKQNKITTDLVPAISNVIWQHFSWPQAHRANSHNTNSSKSHYSLDLTCFTPGVTAHPGIMRLNILPACQSQHAHPYNEDKWSAPWLRTAALSTWLCVENTAVKAASSWTPKPATAHLASWPHWSKPWHPAQGAEDLLTIAAFYQPERYFQGLFDVLNIESACVNCCPEHLNRKILHPGIWDHFGERIEMIGWS